MFGLGGVAALPLHAERLATLPSFHDRSECSARVITSTFGHGKPVVPTMRGDHMPDTTRSTDRRRCGIGTVGEI